MTDLPIPTPLRLYRSDDDSGRARLTVEGEVDLSTAERFEAALLDALAGQEQLDVDLRSVGFMDSTGLRALLVARRRAEDAGATICLAVEPEGPVERLLDLAGVTELFPRSKKDSDPR